MPIKWFEVSLCNRIRRRSAILATF